MNTRKRFGISAIILFALLLSGCAPVPMYQDGYYSGSVPGWDVGRIAGAGTGAALGAVAGAVVGNPFVGAVMGATLGGMTPSYIPPPPMYIPQQQIYVPPQPVYIPQPQQQYVPPAVQYYMPPQSQEYYSNDNAQIPSPPPPPPTCKERYDSRVQTANVYYQTKAREIEQFRSDTGNDVDYSHIMGDLKAWYPEKIKNAEAEYFQCIGIK